jgi:hypothetical protein
VTIDGIFLPTHTPQREGAFLEAAIKLQLYCRFMYKYCICTSASTGKIKEERAGKEIRDHKRKGKCRPHVMLPNDWNTFS